ncbi:UDP:flavonoid glycosyltransferase YjiC (YdhE family) [Ciceribacter lividus]|uniref:UDP:flavonoid glycosyltransferase YjiC (YdhE family) n=1 Tax=Ciceribacter lividus TaxID=1197950 RepID=A0A6I7HUX0_9HYPH|nr:glycosyltransferase [Ciceribacter lividus]RCW28625.1 UDP:flavonoid glycosyltransferase YjiC (YdhE family) [Ciceribacter lividus]
MRVTIFTIGTEGDVRPLVALGVGLARKGHIITIATDKSCADLVTAHGLNYRPLSGDFRSWMHEDPDLHKQGLSTPDMARKFRDRLRMLAEDWPRQGMAAAADADLLIGNGMVFLLADSIAERLDLPVAETQLVPTLPSRNPPLMPLPRWMYRLPGAANRLLGRLSRRLVWSVMAPAYQEVVRPGLGLDPYTAPGPLSGIQSRHLRLFGYSPTLVPPDPEWPDTVQVTGAWVLPASSEYKPSPELTTFLLSGPRPIYAGFGSMTNIDADALTGTMARVARETGRRFVLATGWGGLQSGEIADCPLIHVVQHVPHDWLLPLMAAAIHHGGAGTSIAAARAGIPSIIVPVFGDQPFWASRLQRLGAAPPPIRRSQMTEARLQKALRAVEDPAMQRAAAELGQRLRREDGVDTAIGTLEAWGLIRSNPASLDRQTTPGAGPSSH